jgi:hypothetical protein
MGRQHADRHARQLLVSALDQSLAHKLEGGGDRWRLTVQQNHISGCAALSGC